MNFVLKNCNIRAKTHLFIARQWSTRTAKLKSNDMIKRDGFATATANETANMQTRRTEGAASRFMIFIMR
jgi:hypothetical protein